jgi:hypothetical protein
MKETAVDELVLSSPDLKGISDESKTSGPKDYHPLARLLIACPIHGVKYPEAPKGFLVLPVI